MHEQWRVKVMNIFKRLSSSSKCKTKQCAEGDKSGPLRWCDHIRIVAEGVVAAA